ncbi:MAG: NAD(P)-binding protein [Clostridia bacterium]|nr:NAD(P)-binding protein [Clostridia bacterium]
MAEVKKQIPTIWTTGWTDIMNTGTWRSAIPVYQRRPSPCHEACPVGGDIPVWIQQAKAKQYEQAWLTLVENNPFPAVTGRICHHPCEGGCNRGEYDGAVSVNSLEQFIGDLALENGWELPQPTAKNNKKVAVVGGGPAGLSCAYQLAGQGYGVTIFEARPEPGGILRYGIPEYRLPKEVLQKEIQRLLKLGITVCTNTAVKTAEDFAGLETEYAAVFLALGAHRAKGLPVFEENNPKVLDCLDVLSRVNQGAKVDLGEQVVVIGGGSSAMDVARTARRLGSQVKVVALETRDIMPAQQDEVREALEEGVMLYDGAMTKSAASSGGETMILNCIKVVLDQNVPPGILKPIPIAGTEFKLEANTVILAIGLEPELYDLPKLVGVDGTMVKVDANLATGRRGVFAGGDVTTPYRFVSAAIGAGKKGAREIIRYLNSLNGAAMTEQVNVPEPVSPVDLTEEVPPVAFTEVISPVAFTEVNLFYFPVLPRVDKGSVPADLRIQDFREVKTVISEAQALEESERCFSCGNCIRCNNCFYFCPDQAIAQDQSLAEGYSIRDRYCKGCGLCVEECPRGAVLLKEEQR